MTSTGNSALVMFKAFVTSTTNFLTVVGNKRHWSDKVWGDSKHGRQYLRWVSTDDAVDGSLQHYRTSTLQRRHRINALV